MKLNFEEKEDNMFALQLKQKKPLSKRLFYKN